MEEDENPDQKAQQLARQQGESEASQDDESVPLVVSTSTLGMEEDENPEPTAQQGESEEVCQALQDDESVVDDENL